MSKLLKHPDNPLNRRQLLVGSAVLATATTLAACSTGEDDEKVRPEGVPLGPFGAESTAEQVVEGINLTGKTALITGATSGLGYETMRVLALRGAHVICAGRTKEKAEQACAGIQGHTTPVVIELTDFPSIVAGTDAVRALNTPIDMLILNAGIMALPKLE
ncbi:MAG: SDR family NAD(P)-dependent oxidoreductase, partial [Gammaproteobacteria bacterium]